MTSAVLVIPARYASTRLPGKMLLAETGKYLVQHVYEAARRARGFERVLIATDDERIERAVRSFGGDVEMTSRDCPSGTDRMAEVARRTPGDVFVNLQGDEPEMDPGALTRLVERLAADPDLSVATLATPIHEAAEFRDPAAVKVVLDGRGRALYFSRAPIPWPRDDAPPPPGALKHLGVYAFRREALFDFAAAPPADLEKIEKLEQLRLLAMGRAIGVHVVEGGAIGVDTPDDYARFVARWRTV